METDQTNIESIKDLHNLQSIVRYGNINAETKAQVKIK